MKASDSDSDRSLSHQLYLATPTNRSSSSLLLNRTLHTCFSLLYPDMEQCFVAKQADQMLQHAQHVKTCTFQVDQQVMAHNL